MLIQYSPNPHCYAILRIDHLATVEHFPYPDIIDAAKKMQPKTYLVYLRNALSIPFPQDPWFPFIVVPVAPLQPPADGHFTPEMCIPIYPNASHPAGREPVHTELPFPYDNCYHWSNARGFNVRVRPRKNGYFDEDVAVRPRIRDEGELWRMVAADRTKVEEADAPDRPMETPLPATPVSIGPKPDTQEDCSSIQGGELGLAQDEPLENDLGEVDGQSCASDEVISEFQAIVGMGVFGTRLDNKDDYPLVDVWLELADHLKQEDIPDPRNFYAECDTLIQ
ncbi:hypothetical protein GSI_04353 [Ganoderma sinense ZZ0214-1]|uniref:Uncharacterized protein n=1 Tax=Ganoderma sinense ZZ0214-1 TaxID=1077348 RepID=A0A2G8SJK1_9APHY|nr:hypothetical protein GSI_04353 [Ganoderma sinense ZZ0214-1]